MLASSSWSMLLIDATPPAGERSNRDNLLCDSQLCRFGSNANTTSRHTAHNTIMPSTRLARLFIVQFLSFEFTGCTSSTCRCKSPTQLNNALQSGHLIFVGDWPVSGQSPWRGSPLTSSWRSFFCRWRSSRFRRSRTMRSPFSGWRRG